MRTYIIGNDGIALCRETPAAVNDGEMVVSSKEELLAAPLNGKRLLALWNALPGVDKRRRVGDRAALIEQLWSAIERLPDPEPRGDPKRPSKQDVVIAMLRQPAGATVDEVANVTGWQRHTVRGVFSGSLKKKLGLTLASAKEERGRVYRIAERASAGRVDPRTRRLARILARRRMFPIEAATAPAARPMSTSPRSTVILSICSIARRKNCGLHGANCIAPARRRGSVAIC